MGPVVLPGVARRVVLVLAFVVHFLLRWCVTGTVSALWLLPPVDAIPTTIAHPIHHLRRPCVMLLIPQMLPMLLSGHVATLTLRP